MNALLFGDWSAFLPLEHHFLWFCLAVVLLWVPYTTLSHNQLSHGAPNRKIWRP